MTRHTYPHALERSIQIEAPRDVVARYFADSEHWASWWGAGSTIDARPGGRVLIRMPGGIEVAGDVIASDLPSAVAFTYGYSGGTPIPPGGSLVRVRLNAAGEGTQLNLSHAFTDEGAREAHVQGWRYQLSRLANLVADRTHGNVEALVDRWLAAWSEPDRAAREREVRALVTADITVRDRFTCVSGLEDLLPQIAAVQQFVPGLRLTRDGAVQHCQGTAVTRWRTTTADGTPRGSGTAVFDLAGGGRLRRVTVLWADGGPAA